MPQPGYEEDALVQPLGLNSEPAFLFGLAHIGGYDAVREITWLFVQRMPMGPDLAPGLMKPPRARAAEARYYPRMEYP